MYAKSLQLCLTLCSPMDYSPTASFVHGILQARILEWIAMPSLQGIFQTPALAGGFFTTWTLYLAPRSPDKHD